MLLQASRGDQIPRHTSSECDAKIPASHHTETFCLRLTFVCVNLSHNASASKTAISYTTYNILRISYPCHIRATPHPLHEGPRLTCFHAVHRRSKSSRLLVSISGRWAAIHRRRLRWSSRSSRSVGIMSGGRGSVRCGGSVRNVHWGRRRRAARQQAAQSLF